MDQTTEVAVTKSAPDVPAYGRAQTSNELRRLGALVSPSGMRSIWLQHNLTNFKNRLNLDLSCFRTALSANVSQLPFERYRTFPAQCGLAALRIIEPLCGCPFQCKKFFRLLGTRDQCSRMSRLSMQLSHAAGLYGVRGLGPIR